MQINPDLRLNLIPIKFNKDAFKGYEIPYSDADQLKDLREKYRDSHLFRRWGDVIHCIPLNESAEALGKEKLFSLKNDFVLVEYLVQNSLIRFFSEKGATFVKLFHPTCIVVEKENLMKDISGNKEIAELLPMYPEYEVESRILVPNKGLVTFGILVNFSVRHLIDCTVAKLIKRGVDLNDRYVVVCRDNTNEPSIVDGKYHKKLAGRIIGIEGSKLKLTDYLDRDEIDSGSCYPESSLSNFIHCLTSLSSEDTEKLTKKRLSQVFKVTGAMNQYERLKKVKEWFAKSQPIHCSSDLSFDIENDIYEPGYGNETGQYRRLNNPSYVLRPGGSITVTGRIDKHIDEKGPFDAEEFPKKRIRIAVICPERHKGNAEVFIRQFKDGVPPRRNKETPYLQGFIRKYRLSSCDFDFFAVRRDKENAQGYKEACLEALQKFQGYDLAIIVTKEEYHQLYGGENPYFVAKSTFMSQGVPVQALEIETILDERGRPWILNNMALACYAKFGGIPWVLSSIPGMAHELIFGIGSSRVQTERLGDTERFVGITTVFSGDGNYLLYNLTKEVRYEEFKDALLRSLKDCMDEIKARYAWQKGDKVRLVFHQAFKKFKKEDEVKAVKDFVDEITDFDVEYAFVQISRSHPWKFFDKNSKGVPHWEADNGYLSKTTKGEYVPQRGFYSSLGPHPY